MNFDEANTVEAFLRDRLSGDIQQTIAPSDRLRQPNDVFFIEPN